MYTETDSYLGLTKQSTRNQTISRKSIPIDSMLSKALVTSWAHRATEAPSRTPWSALQLRTAFSRLTIKGSTSLLCYEKTATSSILPNATMPTVGGTITGPDASDVNHSEGSSTHV